MRKPHLFFGAYLAALLMLAAVPSGAAKQLFTTDLADYPGKEARLLEVSYPRGGAQRQRHGVGQVSRSAAEGQGRSRPHAREKMTVRSVKEDDPLEDFARREITLD